MAGKPKPKGYDIVDYRNQQPLINLKINPKVFNQVYYPMLRNYEYRYNLYCGSRASGKSHFICQKLIIKALSIDLDKIIVMRRYATNLQNSVFSLFLDTLERWKLLQYCKVNRSQLSITLPNGSFIVFKGCDEPEKIKSLEGFSTVWFEEATQFDEYTVQQIDFTIRNGLYQQLYFSFNPTNVNHWLYKKYFSPDADYSKDNTFVLTTTYADNQFLDESFYKNTLEPLQISNPLAYKIYALGLWVSLDKLVLPYHEVQTIDRKAISHLPLICGIDFGWTDETAFVAGRVDEDNKLIYIIDEHLESEMTAIDIANMIKAKGLDKSIIIADSASPTLIAELKAEGIQRIKGSIKGKDSVLTGISRLQEYKIIIDTKCEGMAVALDNYSYEKDKSTGQYTNKINHDFSHLPDALRYAIQCQKVKVRVKSLNKSLFGF